MKDVNAALCHVLLKGQDKLNAPVSAYICSVFQVDII